MTLVLLDKDVRTLLTMPDTVQVLEKAFIALAEGGAENQPRSRMMLANGILHLLPAAIPFLGVLGFKTYTAFREGVRSVILLFSAQDGQLLAIIEADWLGCMRTGGTSGLATKCLARPEATVVGLLGAGHQAVTQLRGVCAVRPITRVNVYSRRPKECAIFCEAMSHILNVEVQPVVSARKAVEVADILITATPSTEPVLHGEWIPQGCHINAIGSNWAQKREIDYSTLQRSYLIVTDSREQARAEAGDLIIPADEGLFDWERVYELADVVSGRELRLQRNSPQDITLYKGLGIGLEDVATAACVYALAKEQGRGQEIELLT